MKKTGFTLQELLISLAIIGVVAAMTVPAIVRIMPDETKTRYMKAYNALTSITNDLLSDNTIYWTQYTNGVPDCRGLNCISKNNYNELFDPRPEMKTFLGKITGSYHDSGDVAQTLNGITKSKWEDGLANMKYPIFLASRMNLQTNPTCSSNFVGGSEPECTFTTTDGTFWRVSVGEQDDPITVTIDVIDNGDDNSTTMQDVINDNKDINDVDTFIFEVSKEGSIQATDELGKTFLRTPTDMHRKSEDREEAKKKLKKT